MKRIPIICSGGIGDTLLALSEIPIAALGRFGVRFTIFYETRDHPAWKILFNVLESIKFCEVSQRCPTKNEYRIRNAWKKIIRHLPFLFAPPFKKSNLSSKSEKRRILIQTHLDGHHGYKHLNAKVWPIDRWCNLLCELNKIGWEIGLLEYDDEALNVIKRNCPFVIDSRKNTFLDTILHIRSFDFVLSVDSWTKYVAGWWKIPQVVIVPDLRIGYTPVFKNIDANVLVEKWFRGLSNNAKTKLIGLEKGVSGYQFTLPSILDLKTVNILSSLGK